jgi:DNA polymerase-3 subunit alpha
MRPSKIIGIKRIGIKKAVDIEVESNEHIFYANNIATSNSHGVGYAMMTYWSAWVKCYYNKKFFKNWLRNADEKADPNFEKRQLIMAAKSEGINVRGPNIKLLEDNFSWHDNAICFGICNVKNVGSAHLEQLKKSFADLPQEKMNWTNILINILPNINKRAIENLISVGAFTGLGKSRSEMLHEYHCMMELTDKEISYIVSNFDTTNTNISELLSKIISLGTKKQGGGISTQNRLEKIENILVRVNSPGRSLLDNSVVYAKIEEQLLSYSINHSELNACSGAAHANATCKEVADGKSDNSILAVMIKRLKEYKTKNGDCMAFLSVEDDSGELENIVVFPDIYEQNKDIMYERATVLISGEIKDKKKNSFIVDKIFVI